MLPKIKNGNLLSKDSRCEIVLGAWLLVVNRRNSLLYDEIAGAEPTLKRMLSVDLLFKCSFNKFIFHGFVVNTLISLIVKP